MQTVWRTRYHELVEDRNPIRATVHGIDGGARQRGSVRIARRQRQTACIPPQADRIAHVRKCFSPNVCVVIGF